MSVRFMDETQMEEVPLNSPFTRIHFTSAEKWVLQKCKFTAEIANSVEVSVHRKYQWTTEIRGGKLDKKMTTVQMKIEESLSAVKVCTGGECNLGWKKTEPMAKTEDQIDDGEVIDPRKAHQSIRELVVAKSKMNEIRQHFNNFRYRRRVAIDEEECKRFAERIVTLLIEVDAIQGVDIMVQAGRRSMVEELESLLDAVESLLPNFGSMKLKKIELHEGITRHEIVDAVQDVIQMLDKLENATSSLMNRDNNEPGRVQV